MSLSKSNNRQYKARPSSSTKLTLPPICPYSASIDFNSQNQVCNGIYGPPLKVQSSAMKKTMHSCILPLRFVHPITKQTNSGTAFLISEDIAMTSAHNIYDKNVNKQHLEIILGPAPTEQGQQLYYLQAMFFPQQFIAETEAKRSTLHDYAFLKLKVPIKLPSYLLPTIHFNGINQKLAIYGYPGSRYHTQDDTIKVGQYGLQGQNEIIQEKDDKELKKIKYYISTQKGQSGCPVIIGKGQRNQVIAIHKGGDKTKQINYGRIITMDMLTNLEIWRDQYRGSQFTCFDYSTGYVFNFGERYKDFIDMIQKERAKRIAAQYEKTKQIPNQKVQLISPTVFAKEQIPAEKTKPYTGYKRKASKSNLFPQVVLPRMLNNFDLVEQPIYIEQIKSRIKNVVGQRKIINYPKALSFWDVLTKYASQFNISNKTITKKYSSGIFQITSSQPVASVSKTKFTLHSYSKDIILGLIKSQKISFPFPGGSNLKGSIAYSTDYLKKKGKIIINGEVKEEKKILFVEPAGSVTIEVNKESRIILFTISSKSYVYTLDDQLYKEEWFIFARLNSGGDKIQVM